MATKKQQQYLKDLLGRVNVPQDVLLEANKALKPDAETTFVSELIGIVQKLEVEQLEKPNGAPAEMSREEIIASHVCLKVAASVLQGYDLQMVNLEYIAKDVTRLANMLKERAKNIGLLP